jgi:hypothetical protein
MTTPRHNANGHRRREIVARVLAEETLCALCQTPVDKTLTVMPGKHGPKCTNPTCPGCTPHPMSPVVDEDIPRARGGSPYDRANTHLMHRTHNRWKGTMTLAEARAKWKTEHTTATVEASPIW